MAFTQGRWTEDFASELSTPLYWGYIVERDNIGDVWGYMGIMEKNMETTLVYNSPGRWMSFLFEVLSSKIIIGYIPKKVGRPGSRHRLCEDPKP